MDLHFVEAGAKRTDDGQQDNGEQQRPDQTRGIERRKREEKESKQVERGKLENKARSGIGSKEREEDVQVETEVPATQCFWGNAAEPKPSRE